MTIDKMDGFEALQHYGIQVARSKYVDSAEDAIAFAERRTAADPRFMPILLRSVPSGAQAYTGSSLTEEPLETEKAVRAAFEHLRRAVGTSKGHILAQTMTDSGTDIKILGRTDDELGKQLIALRSATHSVERMIPLDTASAEALVANFQGYHHHGSSEKTRRMLEHLLMRVSKFFDDCGVTQFSIDVRMRENSYTVLDAMMTSPAALHVKKRLDPRAHDRKGDDYHPGGRQ